MNRWSEAKGFPELKAATVLVRVCSESPAGAQMAFRNRHFRHARLVLELSPLAHDSLSSVKMAGVRPDFASALRSITR